jgi:hypothetical protein
LPCSSENNTVTGFFFSAHHGTTTTNERGELGLGDEHGFSASVEGEPLGVVRSQGVRADVDSLLAFGESEQVEALNRPYRGLASMNRTIHLPSIDGNMNH